MSGVRLPRPLLLLQHLPDTPTQAGTRSEGGKAFSTYPDFKNCLNLQNYSLKNEPLIATALASEINDNFDFPNFFDAIIMFSLVFVIQSSLFLIIGPFWTYP